MTDQEIALEALTTIHQTIAAIGRLNELMKLTPLVQDVAWVRANLPENRRQEWEDANNKLIEITSIPLGE